MQAKFITLLALIVAMPLSGSLAIEPLVLEVRETAGIQRFVYPVSAEFRRAGESGRFRLRDGQRPVPAQFTLLKEGNADDPALWSIDFNVDLLPNETRRLTLDVDGEESSSPRERSGLEVKRVGGKIHVSHPAVEFVVAEDLRGLLESIRVRGDDYLVAGAAGLVIRLRDGRKTSVPAAAPSGECSPARIVKSGPLAAALEFASREKLSDGTVLQSTVRLDFPLGKSWARVDWTLDDPANAVAAIGAELRLRLDRQDAAPILADVGAGGWTYAALRPEESLVFRVRSKTIESDSREPAWQVDRLVAGRGVPYARPSIAGPYVPPQGWAHLLDAKRATAIAVDRFAAETDDTIELGEDGHVHLWREIAPTQGGQKPENKRLTFWLHVVSTPPQRGAATNPQSMLAPPAVRVVGSPPDG
jgi:hypothetical protein